MACPHCRQWGSDAIAANTWSAYPIFPISFTAIQKTFVTNEGAVTDVLVYAYEQTLSRAAIRSRALKSQNCVFHWLAIGK